MGHSWSSDVISLVVHSLMNVFSSSVCFWVVIVGNFLEDFNVRFVDSFSLWNPLGVNFILENSLGWFNILHVFFDIILFSMLKIFISLSSSSPVVGNFNCVVELEMGWGSVGSWGEFG